jgi:branched-chain amino acid transport system ATP-binding protein
MLDMMKLLEKVNDSGITLLMIEHVMRAVMSLAERIYVLNHGQLISHGTPEEVSNDEKVIECYLGKGEA